MKKQPPADRVIGYRSWLECRNASADLIGRGWHSIGFNRGFVCVYSKSGQIRIRVLFVLPGAVN